MYQHTDCDGLDLDAVLDVSTVGVVGLLVREHRLAAQGVDEGGSAWEEATRLDDDIATRGRVHVELR